MIQISIKINRARDRHLKNIFEKCSIAFCNCTENFSKSERGGSYSIPIESKQTSGTFVPLKVSLLSSLTQLHQ